MKEFRNALRLSKRLMAGQRIPLFLLLGVLLIFQIEAPLVLPLLLKEIFFSITALDAERLNIVLLTGFLLFCMNVVLMYIVNVYGDPLVTKFSFVAAENSFLEMGKLPTGTIENYYSRDDLFQRVAAGTGNIMGMYFGIVDILGNCGAIVAVLYVIADVSDGMFRLALIIIAFQAIRMAFQYWISQKINQQIQESRTDCIRFVKTLTFDHEFLQMNHIVELVHVYYAKARGTWFHLQMNRTISQSAFQSVGDFISGMFKLFLLGNILDSAIQLKTYVLNITSLYTAFDTIAVKANIVGSKVASFPVSMVPIKRLDEIFHYEGSEIKKEEEESYLFHNINVKVGNKQILQDISVEIPRFGKIAIMGENGSGKTTLLKVMAGLCTNPTIKTNIGVDNIIYMPADNLLFNNHLVSDNILYCTNQKDEIQKTLEEVAIEDVNDFMSKYGKEISGGEAKRVNYVRSILSGKELILADEPTSSLDEDTAAKVMNHLLGDERRACVYVTHSLKWAELADEIWLLRDGEVYKCLSDKDIDKVEGFVRVLQKAGERL